MLDVVGALLALTWCMPLLAVCAAAVRIETPGPVFYSQDRIGFRRRRFRVWKIRTMQIDAEVDGVPQWSKANDDRITRVGAFLRRFKIDEIPQFYNVLKGDMSMIGPRPERPEFVEYLEQHIPYYKIRHSVKPGISGGAQINFPYASTIEQTKRKLEYDLYCIKNYSLLLDVIVVLQTLRVIL